VLKKLLNTIFMFVGIIVMLGCSTQPEQSVEIPKKSTAIPLPTFTPEPSPTPEPITFDNVCDQYGQEVSIEGIIHLPNEISCTSGGNPNWCTAQLLDVDRSGYMVIGLNIESGKYNPIENYMADLPTSYEISDFKVQADGGQLIGEGDLVKITGKVTSPLLGTASGQETNCSLSDIQKIESVSRITIQEPERLTAVNLLDAITKGWVIATISGNGLSKIDISLKPQMDFNLELSIEPGTVFESQSGGVQNMVLRQGTVVVLKPNIGISLELEVSCANMELEEPSGADTFTISGGTSDDLLKLLRLSEFRFENGRIQQFAVWTITDNPARNNYTGITDQYGTGSGPTGDEIEIIRSLFQSAGINTSKYKVFNS
jgi:hypothetical protein